MYLVVNRETYSAQPGAFESKADAEAHVERILKQFAGRMDDHTQPDYVVVKVPDKE